MNKDQELALDSPLQYDSYKPTSYQHLAETRHVSDYDESNTDKLIDQNCTHTNSYDASSAKTAVNVSAAQSDSGFNK